MYRIHIKGIVKQEEEIKSYWVFFSLCDSICKGFNRLKFVIVLKDHSLQHHELTNVHLNKRDLLRCLFSDFFTSKVLSLHDKVPCTVKRRPFPNLCVSDIPASFMHRWCQSLRSLWSGGQKLAQRCFKHH